MKVVSASTLLNAGCTFKEKRYRGLKYYYACDLNGQEVAFKESDNPFSFWYEMQPYARPRYRVKAISEGKQ